MLDWEEEEEEEKEEEEEEEEKMEEKEEEEGNSSYCSKWKNISEEGMIAIGEKNDEQ